MSLERRNAEFVIVSPTQAEASQNRSRSGFGWLSNNTPQSVGNYFPIASLVWPKLTFSRGNLLGAVIGSTPTVLHWWSPAYPTCMCVWYHACSYLRKCKYETQLQSHDVTSATHWAGVCDLTRAQWGEILYIWFKATYLLHNVCKIELLFPNNIRLPDFPSSKLLRHYQLVHILYGNY